MPNAFDLICHFPSFLAPAEVDMTGSAGGGDASLSTIFYIHFNSQWSYDCTAA